MKTLYSIVVALHLCASGPGEATAGTRTAAVEGIQSGAAANAPDTPAGRRLRELLAAVENGRAEEIARFVRAAYAAELMQRYSEPRIVETWLALYDRTRGFTVEEVREESNEAVALLRSRLTGLTETVSLRVDATAPHRIVGPATTLRLGTPPHPLRRAGVSDAERVAEIDRIVRKLADAELFSGVLLVARGPKVLYHEAFGLADRERRIPVRRDSRFDLASLTKTFTSVAVAQLVEQGRVGWDDPLGRFVPDFPLQEARSKVRVKHLLTHTAGLADTLRYCEREACPRTYLTLGDYVKVAAAAQGEELLFEPGTQAPYTNANLSLLATIIERVTGEPFYAYVQRNVFGPARMRDTRFIARGSRGPGVVTRYHRLVTPDGVKLSGSAASREPSENYPAPFCCTPSTARDLHRFAHALRSGKLLDRATADLLMSPKPEAGSWGYGFDVYDEERGIAGHGGSWSGVSNSIELHTKSGYVVVILSNHTNGRSPLREAIRAILP